MNRFPPSSFYHWAEPVNLPSIRQHGLLSTERLISLAGLNDAKKLDLLSQYRPHRVELPNGSVIRDQTPMPPDLLAKALTPGVSPSDWYRLLNGFIFLWGSFERAERHRVAFGRSSVMGEDKRDDRLTPAFSQDEKRARLDRLASNSTRPHKQP